MMIKATGLQSREELVLAQACLLQQISGFISSVQVTHLALMGGSPSLAAPCQ